MNIIQEIGNYIDEGIKEFCKDGFYTVEIVDQIFGYVMKKGKGHYNPQFIKQCVLMATSI